MFSLYVDYALFFYRYLSITIIIIIIINKKLLESYNFVKSDQI